MEHVIAVNDIAEALIREYLTKHRLSGTLDLFNAEKPKTATSVTKADHLRQQLGLERHAARLKRTVVRISSTLELWVEYQQAKTLSRSQELRASAEARQIPLQHQAKQPPAPPPASPTIAAGRLTSYQAQAEQTITSAAPAPSSKEPAPSLRSMQQADSPSSSIHSSWASVPTSAATPEAAADELDTEALPEPPSPSLHTSSSRSRHTAAAAAAAAAPAGAAAAVRTSWTAQEPAAGYTAHRPGPAAAADGPAEPDAEPDAGVQPLPSSSAASGLRGVTCTQLQPLHGRQHSSSSGGGGGVGVTAEPRSIAACSQQAASPKVLSGSLGWSNSGSGAASSNSAAAGGRPSSSTAAAPGSARTRARPPEVAALQGLCLEDVEDLEEAEPLPSGQAPSPHTLPSPTAAAASRTQQPSLLPAAAGKEKLSPAKLAAACRLLWGAAGQPPSSWQQGFFFSETPGLEAGLVQQQGGPCGVIASVQAYLLAELASGCSTMAPAGGLSSQQRQESLDAALAAVIWTAATGSSTSSPGSLPGSTTATLVFSSAPGSLAGLAHGQLCHTLLTASASSLAELRNLVKGRAHQYTERGGWGVPLLLYSVLATKGPAAAAAEMQDAGGGCSGCSALVAEHGYCGQELVNLLLTGVASGNLFNGVRDLGDGMVLRGVQRRSRVGLLTLFEWYRYLEVGSFLKRPLLPVWVVCSESHYSVLYSASATSSGSSSSAGACSQLPLRLAYYDPLAQQDGPIALELAAGEDNWTARMEGVSEERGCWRGQVVPPLELIAATKWPAAVVTWHGCEPLL